MFAGNPMAYADRINPNFLKAISWFILEYLDPFLTLAETEKLMVDKRTYLIIFFIKTEIKRK